MTKLPWFRAYTDMVDDEKLRLLAFEDRWHFVGILCLKGQGVLDANDPLLMRKVAVKLGIDLRTLEEVARRLSEVGLIDRDTLQPLAWDARQFTSDSSKERVARYRAKKRASHGNGDVTLQKRSGNAVDTDTDKDTDTEEDTDNTHAVGADDIDVTATRKAAPQEDAFELAWVRYPKRAGGNPKAAAKKAWDARVKAGVDPQDMLAGVQRYARFCEATGKVRTEYVKQAATFFGPGMHFMEEYPLPVASRAANPARPSINDFDDGDDAFAGMRTTLC